MKKFSLYCLLLFSFALQASDRGIDAADPEVGSLNLDSCRGVSDACLRDVAVAPPTTPVGENLHGRVSADSRGSFLQLVSDEFLPEQHPSIFAESLRSPEKDLRHPSSEGLRLPKRPGVIHRRRSEIKAPEGVFGDNSDDLQRNLVETCHDRRKQHDISQVIRLKSGAVCKYAFFVSRLKGQFVDTSVAKRVQQFRADGQYEVAQDISERLNFPRIEKSDQRVYLLQSLLLTAVKKDEASSRDKIMIERARDLLRFDEINRYVSYCFAHRIKLASKETKAFAALEKQEVGSYLKCRQEEKKRKQEAFLVEHVERVMQGSSILEVRKKS